MSEGPNAQQAAYWNAAHHWVTAQREHDEMLEEIGRRAQAALKPQRGERILDIGCGAGTTTLQLADAVGPSGAVVGLDVSALLLGAARERAAARPNVSFVEADAQTHGFEQPFHAAFSRFGVMFFSDPTEAFANIRRALRPAGRLAFACWQGAERNEWWSLAERVAREHMELPRTEGTGPNPFAFGDPDFVRGMLADARFEDVELADVRTPILLGGRGTPDTATGFLRESRLGRTIGEVASDPAAVFAAVRDALVPFATDRGVEMDAAVWIVTARRS